MRERPVGQCLLDPGCNSQDGRGERNKRWVSYPCEVASASVGKPDRKRILSCPVTRKPVRYWQASVCSTLASISASVERKQESMQQHKQPVSRLYKEDLRVYSTAEI